MVVEEGARPEAELRWVWLDTRSEQGFTPSSGFNANEQSAIIIQLTGTAILPDLFTTIIFLFVSCFQVNPTAH